MKISFIAPPVNMSGGIRVIAIYAQKLQRMGHDVRVISPPPRTLSTIRKARLWLKGNRWPRDELSPKSHLDGSEVIHQTLDRWRPVNDDDVPDGDVVIATWWETAEWVNKLKASKGAKVYFIQHHEIFPHLQVQRSRATYLMPLHKIVVARWLQEVMSAEYGDDVVDLVPNSVDHDQFFAPPREKQTIPTIGFLYHSGHAKGLDLTLAAHRIVRARFPNLRVIAFGSERPVDGLLLPSGSEFFFSPAQNEIRNIYARCDVWVTASRTEGFNLPAMEAMACRTPVVATRTGWPAEAVKSGDNGILVEINDVEAIAAGIEWVLSRNDREWKKLSSSAHLTTVESSWDESATLFEQALVRVCRSSGVRSAAKI